MELNNKIDELKDELVKSVQEIVKIRSIEEKGTEEGKPYGDGVAEALDYALKMSENMGFKAVNLDGQVGYAEYGEGDDYVAVLGHLDVVPEGDGWIYPPYGAEIHDGKMYGRGTTDDKGPTIAALYGLKAIKDAGIKLSKRVRIIYGTNEETGESKDIKYYLEKEKPPVAGFTPDGMYPIINGEKGITIFDVVKELKDEDKTIKYIKGGNRPNMVPDYCECAISTKDNKEIEEKISVFAKKNEFDITCTEDGDTLIIKSNGVSAHGSLPDTGKNAIMQLFTCLSSLELPESDLVNYINFFAKHVGMEVYGESFGVGLKDEVSGKLSFNVGVVGMKENSIYLTLNVRYPVTCTYDEFISAFNKTLENTGIKIENMIHQAPLYYAESHPLVRTLQKVYKEQTSLEPQLLSIGGGTYAKEMPNIVAFGPIFPGKPDLDHQANEYIEVEDIILNAKIYANTIWELAK